MISRLSDVFARGCLPEAPAYMYRHHLVMRTMAILGQSLAVLVADSGLNLILPRIPLVVTLASMSALTLATALRLRMNWRVTEGELFAQLLLDVAALTVLLYYTGGWTNPFIALYLLPLTICAASLPCRFTVAIGTVSVAGFGFLVFHYRRLPSLFEMRQVFLPQWDGNAGLHVNLHTIGMFISFVLLAVLVPYYIVRLANALRRYHRIVTEARDKQFTHEHRLALGAMAASTSHELGTPLSTMAVLIQERQRDAESAEVRQDFDLLASQIEACRQALSQTLAVARRALGEDEARLPADQFVARILEQYSLLQPGVPLICQWDATGPAPEIHAEELVAAAILGFLRQAAQHSSGRVRVQAGWSGEALHLRICHRGPQPFPEATVRRGRPLFRQRKGAANDEFIVPTTSITRFGGSVTLVDRPGGEICTEIALRLAHRAAGA